MTSTNFGALRVRRVELPVGDLDTALHFYTEALDFTLVSRGDFIDPRIDDRPRGERVAAGDRAGCRRARLRLGTEHVALVEYLRPRTGRSIPPGSRSNDLSFQHLAVVVSDMKLAHERLQRQRAFGVSPSPQRIPDDNPDAGGIEAFYFRDPDGHNLELIRFPPGRGLPRWQDDGGLFRGIDHTALVVSDTEMSLEFYRDQVGLVVTGSSNNHGAEQESLSGVPGARLRITSLRPPDTSGHDAPGIELLEYVEPSGGRPFPADTGEDDLWSITTVIEVADLEAVPHTDVSDPDGHRIRFVLASPAPW